MQRSLANTFFFAFAVVSAVAAFAYGLFLCLYCPFRDGDLFGIAIMIIVVVLLVPWVEHRRLQRKARTAYGRH